MARLMSAGLHVGLILMLSYTIVTLEAAFYP